MISKRHSGVLKKGVASLLTLAMVLGSVPMPAIAEDAIDGAGVEVAAVEDLGFVEEAAGDGAEEEALDVDGELEFVGDEAVVEGEAPAEEAVAGEEAAAEEEATLEEAAPEEAAVAELGEAVEDVAEIAEATVELGEEGTAEDEAAAAEAEEIELTPVDEDALDAQSAYPSIALDDTWHSFARQSDNRYYYYQFTLSKPSLVSLKMQSAASVNWGLYDEGVSTEYFLYKYVNRNAISSDQRYLSAGTYLIYVRYNYDGEYKDHQLYGTYTTSKVPERKIGSYETAYNLKKSTTVKALNTSHGAAFNYYKIKVPSGSTIRINVQELDGYNCVSRVYLYDDTRSEIGYKNVEGSCVSSYNLSGGTYYIGVNRTNWGPYSIRWELISDNVTNASISGIKSSYVYRGSAIKPNPTVKLNGNALVKDRDYTVSYSNNKNVGTARVTITGIGDYKGSATKTFKITKAKLSNCSIGKIGAQAWTGKACKPNPRITYKGKTLRKGTDYTLTYKRNNKIGNKTASVTIKCRGNFSGSKTIKFSIRFRDVPTSHKFYNAIHAGANKGIVSGYARNGKPTGYFGPNDNLKRCDVAIMFWKAAGSPEPGWGGKNFRDVKRGSYYYKAVRWAASAGVVNGYSGKKSGLFGPNDKVTRQQLYFMLQNYAREECGTSIDKAAIVAQSGIPANKARAKRGEAAFMAYTAYKLSR